MSKADHSITELATQEVARVHRIDWIVQRCAWLLFALVLLAALAGLLGPGPLTHAVESSADGTLVIDYHRIERYESPAKLKVKLPEGRKQPVRLRVGKSFFDAVTMEAISPPPLAIEASEGDPVYIFPASPRGPYSILLRYKPDEFGPLRFAVAIDSDAAFEVQQFILP